MTNPPKMKLIPLFALVAGVFIALSSSGSGSEVEATAEKDLPKPPPPPPVEEPFDMKRIVGRTWVLQAVAGNQVPQEDVFNTAPYMEFNMEGGVAGHGGCNKFSGDYKQSGAGLIQFSEVMSTKMACEVIVMRWESDYTGALRAVRGVNLVADRLYLLDPRGENLLEFKAKR